jgi:FkbM family methyltransferase
MITDRRYLREAFLRLVPSDSRMVYRLAKRYVDLYNGDNDCDMRRNGELRLMQHYLPQCETVFDVGANVGQWTTLALRINPKANIHCFEPSAETFERLLANCFPSNVVCNNVGLSSAGGEAKLFLFGECSGNNSLYHRQGLESFGLLPQQREETVHLDTVDHYCLERGIEAVHFAKVDVEGHELEVFKGMTRLLSSGQVRIVQFEYGGCNIDAGVLLKDIFAFFKGFPYRFYKIHPKGLRLVPKYDQRLENFQYQNWAVIKEGHPHCN